MRILYLCVSIYCYVCRRHQSGAGGTVVFSSNCEKSRTKNSTFYYTLDVLSTLQLNYTTLLHATNNALLPGSNSRNSRANAIDMQVMAAAAAPDSLKRTNTKYYFTITYSKQITYCITTIISQDSSIKSGILNFTAHTQKASSSRI